jgi:hypothetical protein
VRAPAAEEEWALVERGEPRLPAERVTLLLARCVEIGGKGGADLARELTAGDRATLLLELRRRTIGETMRCLLDCPLPDCGEQLELELTVADLLAGGEPGEPTDELRIAGERVVFRLPTGADEERAARRAGEDVEAASRELLAACLVTAPKSWPEGLAEAVEEAIAARDPHARIELAMTCPACARPAAVELDPAAYVWRELQARHAERQREVHLLASRYGWTEAEILALAPARRERYLELVEGEAVAV